MSDLPPVQHEMNTGSWHDWGPYPNSPAVAIERLPHLDLVHSLAISPDYHGPTKFQIYRVVKNNNLFPYADTLPQSWDIDQNSTLGAPIKWQMRYNGNDSPVSQDITGFVNAHPYPHKKIPFETDEQYAEALAKYQSRVYEELSYHIENALTIAAAHPELGTPIFPLAFNGAKPVGFLLTEKYKIPEEQLFTAQVKRVPLTDNSLVIAAGGIQYPKAVKEYNPVYPVFLDDCLATWATQRYLKTLLTLGGAHITGQFYGAVVGTRHPFIDEFLDAGIRTDVSISEACQRLAPNAYLLNPDGTMKVGDMGVIINTAPPGGTLPHQAWGANTSAQLLYQ